MSGSAASALNNSSAVRDHGACITQGIQVDVLNGFFVRQGETDLALPGSAARLVAYLALGGPTHRVRLYGRLWPGVSERNASASLRNALWLVSRRAPGLLHVHASTVQLTPQVVVDLTEFERWAWPIINSSTAGVLLDTQRILTTCGDTELLPGWYEEWLTDPRERIRQLRMHTLEALSRDLLHQRRFALALQVALEVAHMEPLRESSAAAVIAVHLGERNTIEAVRYFTDFANRLHHELGAPPSDELRRMIHLRTRSSG